jgi:hypothetical protein
VVPCSCSGPREVGHSDAVVAGGVLGFCSRVEERVAAAQMVEEEREG